ncbi:GpE family phage tail protein [Novosphingobium sp. FSY-8]|uniref:GpE family phage tail protein n=1 Tax=Novosphingobium ovatum TaxID=1908523 RepID=A0ABW9XAH4_9SPHN|nr:GpE family phage tail protein [Novosphingobium ovatum]
MADIAFIFHWPLADLRALDCDELLHWHELALDRWQKANPPPKDAP